ncbi:hypothetical protein RI367_007357 [Sorochytrium milnesiophthora]
MASDSNGSASNPLKHIDQDKDYYALLELPHDADTASIKKSYYRLSLQLHPDKQRADATEKQLADTAERFQLIKVAYELLSDERSKDAYDAVWRLKREKQERQAALSKEKRKLKTELEAREAVAAKKARQQATDKATAMARGAYVEQLRYEANEMLRNRQRGLEHRVAAASSPVSATPLSFASFSTASTAGGDDYEARTLAAMRKRNEEKQKLRERMLAEDTAAAAAAATTTTQ